MAASSVREGAGVAHGVREFDPAFRGAALSRGVLVFDSASCANPERSREPDAAFGVDVDVPLGNLEFDEVGLPLAASRSRQLDMFEVVDSYKWLLFSLVCVKMISAISEDVIEVWLVMASGEGIWKFYIHIVRAFVLEQCLVRVDFEPCPL